MSNLTGYERDALNQIHAKDTTIARLQFVIVLMGLALVGSWVLLGQAVMLIK